MRLKQKTQNAQDHIISENNQVNGLTYEYVGKIIRNISNYRKFIQLAMYLMDGKD